MSPRFALLLALALAACGHVAKDHPDAAPTGGDAPITHDGPAHGVAQVLVLDPLGSGNPQVGAPVVFLAADGTLVSETVTDTSGKASADVMAGASVTVVLPNGANATQLVTIQAIQPGDHLTVGTLNGDSTQVGTFTVNFTTNANATQYQVWGPCGGTTVTASPATLPINHNCELATLELQVHAVNANNAPIGYVQQEGVPYSAGSTTMPSTYQSYVAVAVSLTNISNVSSSSVNRYAPADRYGYYTTASGQPTSANQSLGVSGPAASSAAMLSYFSTSSGSRQMVRESLNPSATAYTLDLSTNLLPWVSLPTLDVTSGHITVPLDTTGTSHDAPDAFWVSVGYTRKIDANTTKSFYWRVFGPTPGDVTLPVLPADLGGLNPQAGDSVSFNKSAGMMESAALNGWDDARSNVETLGNASDRSYAGKLRTSTTPLLL